MNSSITKRAICLRLNAGLPKRTGKSIDLSNLKNFSCHAYVHISSDERVKLDPKSKKYIFIGYVKGIKGYKFGIQLQRRW